MAIKNKRLNTSIGNIGVAKSSIGFQAATDVGAAITDVGQSITQSLRRKDRGSDGKHPDYQNYQLRAKKNEFDRNGGFDEEFFLADLNANSNLNNYEKSQLRNIIIGNAQAEIEKTNLNKGIYAGKSIVKLSANELRSDGIMNVNGGVNDFSAFLSNEAVDATLKLVKDQVGEDIYSRYTENDLSQIKIGIKEEQDKFSTEISNIQQRLNDNFTANEIENKHKILFREAVNEAMSIDEVLQAVKEEEIELSNQIGAIRKYALGTQTNAMIEDVAGNFILSGIYADKPIELRKEEMKDIIHLLKDTKSEIFIDGKKYTRKTMFEDNYIQADSYVRLEKELQDFLDEVDADVDLEQTIEILSRRTKLIEGEQIGGVQINTTVTDKNMTLLDNHNQAQLSDISANAQSIPERNANIVSFLLTHPDGPSRTSFVGKKTAKFIIDLVEGDNTGETFLVMQNALISLEAQSNNRLNFQVGEDAETLAIHKFLTETNYNEVYGSTPAEKHQTIFSAKPFNFNTVIIDEGGKNQSVRDFMSKPSFAKDIFSQVDRETMELIGFDDRFGRDNDRIRNTLAQLVIANPTLKDYIETAVMTQLRLKIGVNQEKIGTDEFDKVMNNAMKMFAKNFRLDENNVNGISSIHAVIPENFAQDEFKNIKNATFNRDLFTGENGELDPNFTSDNIKFIDYGLMYNAKTKQFQNVYQPVYVNPESGINTPLYNENNQNLLLYQSQEIEELPTEITPDIEQKIKNKELQKRILRRITDPTLRPLV